MRVLAVVGPGGAADAAAFAAAADAFNATLDIRLRFLRLGAEIRVLDLSDAGAPLGAGEGLEVVAEALDRERPAVVVLHGHGPVALAAAVTAAKAGVPLARTGSGRRSGEDADFERAADRLAALCLPADSAARAALVDEGLEERSVDVPADGVADIRRVLRLGRDT